jgi:hypothetical protein
VFIKGPPTFKSQIAAVQINNATSKILNNLLRKKDDDQNTNALPSDNSSASKSADSGDEKIRDL